MTLILYTFRRCPYAIRARMALYYAKINLEQREVDLKHKPEELLLASPKATVPVLILEDGSVLDQSMDIMAWALKQADPDRWWRPELKEQINELIHMNDQVFKPILDNYKYPERSAIQDPEFHREKAKPYLTKLDLLLKQHQYLLDKSITLADIALFPFIRQFYFVDKHWFENSDYQLLKNWLFSFLDSALFVQVMSK